MSNVLAGATITGYSSVSGLPAPSNLGNVHDGSTSTLSEHANGVTPINDGRIWYSGWKATNLNGDGATYSISYVDHFRYSTFETPDTFEISVDGGSTWTTKATSVAVNTPSAGWNRYTLTGGPFNANALRVSNAHTLGGGAGFNWSYYDRFGSYELRAEGTAVGALPVADFTASPNPAEVGETVTFTDTSTGTPTSWAWTFGDGGTSTSQNPTHTYAAAGSYDVTLTATNGSGSDSITKTSFVVVVPVAAAGVYIDWDGDGFDTGTYDDVSADVMSWRISVGAGAEITGGAQPGSCTLVLKNINLTGGKPDNLYNPAYAAGPLYGKLRDGSPIWIGVNSDGALTGANPRGLFGGRIVDITPIPVGGAGAAPTVEITCEDFLGWAARTPLRLDYAEGLAHDAFRAAALDFAGETRISLAHEIQTMPLSHADSDLGSVLNGINAVNGTRHYVEPADSFTSWYTYTTRNRFWRLDGTADGSLDAGSQHVTGTAGWRQSADTVINQQRAAVEPMTFTPGTCTVWTAETLPLEVTATKPYSRWVDFDDVVRDAVVNVASTGATLTSSVTTFGTTAVITLSVASGTAVVSRLGIQGRLARRAPTESYVADDTTSQAAPRGIRAGSEIGGEYLGVMAEARGIADHVVWRYGSPQFRPTLTVENWFPDQFEHQPYEILAFTSAQLAVSARHFEIVGITHEGNIASATAKHHVTTYVLQECRAQSDPGWFVLNTSTLAAAGTDVLHY